MTYDPVKVLAHFAERSGIAYTLLSDSKSEIIGAFGLTNDRFPPGSPWHGFAHPMIMVVDANGIVRHRFSEKNYRQRPKIDDVLASIRGKSGG